jgi:hypothetical protein
MGELQKAVLFLEAGDWESAHAIVQADSTPLGSWAHGIAHMMEGDMSNAGYWFRQAARELPDVSRIGKEIALLKEQVSD